MGPGKDGVPVNYQAIRDQHTLSERKDPHGCCYSQSLARCAVPAHGERIIAGREDSAHPDQMVSVIEKGIYIVRMVLFSIDQQLQLQFGGVLFF